MADAPYVGAHLRRNDWKWAHKDTISTLEDSVAAIAQVAKKRKLKHVFIATDIQVSRVLLACVHLSISPAV